MKTMLNNAHRRNLLRSLISAVICLFILISSIFVITYSSRSVRADSSFGFTVAGDYDQTSYTTANLQKMNQLANANQIAFNIGLGDFSYSSSTNAAAWSTYAKGNLPSGFPFEIVDGRHDSSQIATYEKDLPDQIGDVSATCQPECAYGQQYYFDYPALPATPLARFILISPNQTIPGYTYNYNAGGADFNWVKNTIDAAHSAGIPWVIVGMHQYCFAIGYGACNNQQLLDMLLKEHVDVILQAQQHNYQRSKQLALNSKTCPTLNGTSYNANCAVNGTDSLTKGAGSVIVLTGTGGASQLAVNTTDPKTGYFKTWMPSNNMTWGLSQFTISATQLTEQFDATSGGTFTDSFTISDNSTTPTSTSGTLQVQDTFNRPDQTFWGTASDGQNTWAGNAGSMSNFSIKTNTGQVTSSSTSSYSALIGSTANDAEVLFGGSISSFSSTNIGAILRWNNGSWYKAYINGTNLIIQKKIGSTLTSLAHISFPAAANTSYSLRFIVTGTTLSAKVWQTNQSEPSGWMLTVKDTSLSSGQCGLHLNLQSGVTAQFTYFQATGQ